ncbi:MAG: SUMF1/EgtB/PvdO family nonheme iron enzyme [Gemmatimonadetes bacterium]|nr:SUMF1/EgtB/PvdO family nonheme iron enzyme [Gemmatimonadota bacterium]
MMWHELKRRKVVKVATVYAAAALVVLEVVTMVEEPLGMPAWSDTLVIVLLAAGFVLSVALTWAYELTPDGLVRDSPDSGEGAVQGRAGFRASHLVTATVAAVLGAAIYSFATRDTDRDWLEREALPEIDQRLGVGDWQGAFALAKEVEVRTPESGALAELWPQMSWPTTIESVPVGATVSYKPYDRPDDEWRVLGQTPLVNIRFPYGLSRIRLELEGYRTLYRTLGGGHVNQTELRPPTSGRIGPNIGPERFRLETDETLPPEKVRVSGWTLAFDDETLSLDDYLLDRYEVTNAQYKAFVDGGGYDRPSLWDPVVLEGDSLSWEDARLLFLDSTGQPGPSTWEAGDYPPGQGSVPAAGVSWYEARAYARWVGEELPTVHHWRHAVAPGALSWLQQASNFNGQGPRPVEESVAMSYAGAFDMAGNVREWTSTRIGDRYVILGGSWSDPYFVLAEERPAVPPLDRSPGNGFRLAVTSDDVDVASRIRAPLAAPDGLPQQFTREPEPDAVYNAYSRLFDYERGPLNSVVEDSVALRSWVRQRITFDAGYGGERTILYLYLPTNVSPPYKTVVYWPGWDTFTLNSVDEYFAKQVDFLARRGRAVAFPVYMGSFERKDPATPRPRFNTAGYRDASIAAIKDLRRTLDYLETRSDIDGRSFAFYGYSWGGLKGPTALVQEPRLKSAVIYVGALRELDQTPEIDPINALPRVQVPLLLLSGEFDTVAPLEHARRYYELVGTPEPDKAWVIEPGWHFVPREVLIRETLAWLDRYQGAPER